MCVQHVRGRLAMMMMTMLHLLMICMCMNVAPFEYYDTNNVLSNVSHTPERHSGEKVAIKSISKRGLRYVFPASMQLLELSM